MSVSIRELTTKRDIRDFVELPWSIYQGDPRWVPPLRSNVWSIVTGKDNPLLQHGPHALFLAEQGQRVVGRVMACIDQHLNAIRGRGWGYFSLFESHDLPAAARLLETCEAWLRERGCRVCRGPVSPDNSDGYRGLLVDGFDSPPALLESYNPPHYADFIESCGYHGDGDDRLSYHHQIPQRIPQEILTAVEYARTRWGFRVDRADLKQLDAELASLKTIMDAAMPAWPDMVPPSLEELRLMARQLLPIADADFIYVARTNSGEPIGFLLGLPDYNQVLKHLDGTLFPLGWAKLLWYRRKIDAVRVFVLFVVPSWQKRAVTHAMFLEVARACHRRGIGLVTGSTIVESNGPMNQVAKGVGGRLHKRYRTYEKPL